MEARYLTFNFANLVTVNLIVLAGIAAVVLVQKLRQNRNAAPVRGQ